MKLSKTQEAVLRALRASGEGEDKSSDGKSWRVVYLDNAKDRLKVIEGVEISGHQWAGQLGALRKMGLYRPLDSYGTFGKVQA